MDRGFFLTLQAMRRQLAAMPCDYYQIRLIHGGSRKPFPGDRVGSAVQLTHRATVAFLRLRNREGYDIFFHPFAGNRNAGYILLDLDSADDQIIESMRANGHEPCVVLRTSPGHLQAWVRVSLTPLAPTVATSAAAHLAALYDADRASADWRHCGRLAGFTRNLHAVHLAGTLLGPSCCTHNLAWPPRPLRCWKPLRICSRRLTLLHHALAYLALSPPPAPAVFIGAGCAACRFRSVSLRRTGASPTCGSRNACCAAESLPTKSERCCAWEAPAFPVGIPIPRITCTARWHARPRSHPCLFPRAWTPPTLHRNPRAARALCELCCPTITPATTLAPIPLPRALRKPGPLPVPTTGPRADESLSSTRYSLRAGVSYPHLTSPAPASGH